MDINQGNNAYLAPLPSLQRPAACTVLVSVYNAADKLDRCLESIYRQSYPDFEVVCVDDCSTDKSRQIIDRWRRLIGAKRCRVFSNQVNLGLTKSLNIGLQKIITPFTARLDGDDWWHPEKLAVQIKWLEQHPETGLIGSHFFGITTATGRVKRHYFDIEDIRIKKNLFRRNPFAHSAVIFRTELVRNVGGYNEQCRYGQDYDLWLRLVPLTKFHNIDRFLCWRNTDTGLSIQKQRQQMLQSLKTRFKFINLYHYQKENYRYLIEPFVLVITPNLLKRLKRNVLATNVEYFRDAMNFQIPGIKLFFLNDAILPSKLANAVARTAMARAFATVPLIKQTIFCYRTIEKKPTDVAKGRSIQEEVIHVPLTLPEITNMSRWWNVMIAVITLPRTGLHRISTTINLLYVRSGSLVGWLVAWRNMFNQRLIFFELHNYEFGKNRLLDWLYKSSFARFDRLITVTKFTKENWVAHGIPAQKIMVLPSGADLEKFDQIDQTKNELRRKLSLPIAKRILLYCGHLNRDRGIEDIFFVADKLRHRPDLLFVFLGGASRDIRYYTRYQKRHYRALNNVYFLGHTHSDNIPAYLKTADLLFVTYSRSRKILMHMSPMKLFESMASRVPMIAVDVPRIRDIVTEEMATFYQADDPADLFSQTEAILANYATYKIKAQCAYEEVKKYTWQGRAAKIAEAFSQLS